MEKIDAGRDRGPEEEGTTEDEMADGITDSMDVSLSELWELVMPSNHFTLSSPSPSAFNLSQHQGLFK